MLTRMKKRKVFLMPAVAVILVCIIFSVPIFSNETKAENKIVKVAFYEKGEFQSGAEKGAVKGGYAYEYYRNLAAITGWKYEYVYGDWDQVYTAFLNGDADLIAGITYTEERNELMNFPKHPMGYEQYCIYRLKGNDEIIYDNASLEGKRIGTLPGAVESSLREWLSEYGIKAEVVVFEDVKERDSALINGDIQSFIGDGIGEEECFEAFYQVDGTAFYIATSKNRTDLLDELNNAQNIIYETSDYYIEYLYGKYFKNTAFARTLTREEKRWIEDHPTLKVGYFNDYLPYCDTDENGEPTGIVKDLVPNLIEVLDAEEKIQVCYKGFDDYYKMLEELHAGRIDLIFPADAEIEFGEKNGIFQAFTLFEGNVNLVYLDDCATLEVKRAAVVARNELLCDYVRRNYPDARLVFYDSVTECIKAVNEKKADATFLAGSRTAALLSNASFARLRYVRCDKPFDTSFAVSEDNIPLLNLLNHCISNLDGKNALQLSYQYTEDMYIKSLSQRIKDNSVIVYCALGAIIVAITTILIMYVRAGKKDRKAAEEIRAQYEIVNSLSRDYLNVFLIDPEKNTTEILKLDGYVTEGMDANGRKIIPYDAIYMKYVEDRVAEEDKAMMKEALSLQAITEHTVDGQEYAGSYRVNDNGEIHYYQYKYIRTGNEKQLIAGFQNVDALVNEQREQEERLHKALANTSHHLKIVNALISDYEDVYEINLDKDTSTTFKRNRELFPIDERIVRDYSKTWELFVEKLVYPDDRSYVLEKVNIDALKKVFKEEEEYHFQFRVLNPELHYLQVKFVSLDSKKTKLIVGFRSIDKEIQAEEDRRQTLADALEAAEKANLAKTNFLFNMSHDIRTPMNAIMGFTDLMEKHQDNPAKREDYIQKIKQSSTILLSIINNVLEMARIEKGTVPINETVLNADHLTDTVYSVFQDMMKTKDIEFTREISVVHNYAYCDLIKIREVLINIISNAYKYTNPGGKVHLQLTEIESDKPGYAIYQTVISDTGIGMSQEFLPHLFEEFSREHTTTENKVEGTGLGMPIVKKLLDMMGGTISVESEVGKGSTFTVRIPHRIAEEKDWKNATEGEPEGLSFVGKRLLLAEDNELNAEIAEEILSEVGFEIEHAEDGQKCVDMLLEKNEGYYDAILMDIQMPRMNGYEATKAIRALDNKDKAQIPIIAMTANAFEEDRQTAIACGMNGHLAKPIVVKDLLNTLTKIMEGI